MWLIASYCTDINILLYHSIKVHTQESQNLHQLKSPLVVEVFWNQKQRNLIAYSQWPYGLKKHSLHYWRAPRGPRGPRGVKKSDFFLQMEVLSSCPFGSQNIKKRIFRFDLFSVHLPLCYEKRLTKWCFMSLGWYILIKYLVNLIDIYFLTVCQIFFKLKFSKF